jgi:hypothetical protein
MSNKNIIDLVKTENTIAWNLQFYDAMWFEVDQLVLVYHWSHCAILILIAFIKKKWHKMKVVYNLSNARIKGTFSL